MRIGLISDTHGLVPPEVYEYFQGVEHIFHAGDVGGPNVISDLESIAPVSAVFGNIDSPPLTRNLDRILFRTCLDRQICVVHILGSPRNFSFQLLKMGKKPDLIIFGHTHEPVHTIYQDQHFINPGSVHTGRGGFTRSLAVLELELDKPLRLDFFKI